MEITFNTKNMIEYYKKFDPIEYKYCKLKGKETFLPPDKYLRFEKYEDAQQFGELTKISAWDMQKNLDFSYGDKKRTDEFVELYDLFNYKIINRYINIDGIERLFSEKYADFEWEMHLGYKYDEHTFNYYRDHFIHQLKDAYMMDVLLNQMGFYDKIASILSNEGNSKISNFVCKHLEYQLALPREKVFENYLDDKYLDSIIKKHYLYNIVCMSSYMAGIFHDIGYPTAYSMGENRHIIDYLPESYHFKAGGFDFNVIATLLQNSLLFRVVNSEEIRKRIEDNKADSHGTVSALLFLLHFYENGAIYRLEPYKLCAVELAGLAIYNHTNKYLYQGDEETPYERCIFSLNPISYLLRICDDLQEWERVYFELLNKSNIIICEDCHMPIVRIKDKENDCIYKCNCKGKERLFYPAFEYKQFPNRRLYNVTVCTDMVATYMEGKENYTFRLKYKLDRVLHIAYMNPNYSKHIISELNKMKLLFTRQQGIGMVFVDYFITANVILIKAKIVEEYMDKNGYFDNIDDILGKTYNSLFVSKDTDYDGLCDEWISYISFAMNNKLAKEFSKEDEKFEVYLKNAFTTYLYVCMLMKLGRKCNERDALKPSKELEQIQCEFVGIIKALMAQVLYEPFYTDDVKDLLYDCAIQSTRMFDNLVNYNSYPNSYFKTFKKNDDQYHYYAAVDNFNEIENYVPGKMDTLDAYTDLYYINKIIYKQL
jgi:hypothetical protein